MRARMSDATARAQYTRTRAQECYLVPEVTAGRDALAEARSILADTEAGSVDFTYGHHRFEGEYIKTILSRETQWQGVAELADALAGLCDAPDAAAYLAGMQVRQ